MAPEPLLRDLFARPILDQMPRLLTQVDRNPHSPTYGSCCRNFWHYRIEDISNAQMQELVLTLALVYSHDAPGNQYFQSKKLLRWIEAIVRYTGAIQRPSGSFDEVYRGQDSYAATAFVGFYLSEVLLQLKDDIAPELSAASVAMLRRSAAWLERTNEEFAGNQVSGAAAFLYNLHTLTGEARFRDQGRALLESIRRVQSSEGWFVEYGGADIGYGSLTQAYLSLIHHRHSEALAAEMALTSASFLQHFVHPDGSVGGEYGSRNTEYFIPIGPILMHGASPEMAHLRRFLTDMLAEGRHETIARGLDDRYFAYLSPFYMLAAQLAGDEPAPSDASAPWPLHNVYYPECRMWSAARPGYQLVANLAKGGTLRADFHGAGTVIDDGIFGTTEQGHIFSTQYLDATAEVTQSGGSAVVRGSLFVLKPVLISPLKNVLVRTFNFSVPGALRRIFLDFLRRRAVSSGAKIGMFERTISLQDDGFEVSDRITMTEPVSHAVLQLDKERAFSFASTGFFQSYEMGLVPGESVPVALTTAAPAVLRRKVDAKGVRFLTD